MYSFAYKRLTKPKISQENVSITKKMWFNYILLQIFLPRLNNLVIRTSLKVIKNLNFDACTKTSN